MGRVLLVRWVLVVSLLLRLVSTEFAQRFARDGEERDGALSRAWNFEVLRSPPGLIKRLLLWCCQRWQSRGNRFLRICSTGVPSGNDRSTLVFRERGGESIICLY